MSTKTLLKLYAGRRGELAEAASTLATALQQNMFDQLGRGEAPTGGRLAKARQTFDKVADSLDGGEAALEAAGVLEGDLRPLVASLRDAVDSAEREAKALHTAHLRRALPINPRREPPQDFAFLNSLADTLRGRRR